jgi:hypothetical protein
LKTIPVILLLFGFSFSSISQVFKPLKSTQEITQEYFKIRLEGLSMEEILSELKTSTGLIPDIIIPKSDTTLFYMNGFTNSFNPFLIPVSHIEIQVRENKIQIVGEKKARDTILALQIIAITDSTDSNILNLKKEFRRILKEISPDGNGVNNIQSSKKKKRPSEQYYLHGSSSQHPTIVFGWGGYYKDRKIHCLGLTVYYGLDKKE